MNRFLILLIAIIALTSCGKLKKTSSIDKSLIDSTATTTIEETSIVTRAVDTIVSVQPDTSNVIAPIPLDTTTTKIIDNENHLVTIKVDKKNNKINVVAITKKKDVPIVIKETTTTHRKEKSKVEVKKKEIKKHSEKKRTTFPWWFIWLVLFFICLYYVGRWFVNKYTYTITKKPPN